MPPLVFVFGLFALMLLACNTVPTAGSGDPDAQADSDAFREVAPDGGVGSGLIGTFAGDVKDTDAFVALVADGEQVVGYVCEDGEIAEWFFGPASGNELVLQSPGGAVLQASFDEAAKGTVTLPDGSMHEFTAEATHDTVLYRADSGDGSEVGEDDEGAVRLVAGWIQIGTETRGSVKINNTLQPAPVLQNTIQLQLGKILLNLPPTPMTPDTLSQPTSNTTKFVWGAMGDSFASGEGNPEIPIQPNLDRADVNVDNFTNLRWGDDASIWVPIPDATLRADTFTCHRSDNAGAPKANRRLTALYPGVTFVLGFVACSGAKTVDLTGESTSATPFQPYLGPSTTTESLRGETKVPQPAQIDRIAQFKLAKNQLDAVYMSIGGNNIGFGEIITDCASPAVPFGCTDKWEGVLPPNLTTLADRYDRVNTAIEGKLGTNVKVFISQYPNPIQLEPGTQVAPGVLRSPQVCQGRDYDAFGDVGFGGFDDFFQDNISLGEAAFAFGIPDRMNEVINESSI